MHKIHSNGATVDFKFTEGNAALSVPATVVAGDWLNGVQDELVTPIVGMGLTLEPFDSDDGTQLFQAMQLLHKYGGRATRLLQVVANNQASAADVTGFPQFDKATVKAVEFLYDILRRTDTGHVQETGRCFMSWDSEDSLWKISPLSVGDDADVDFFAAVVSGTNYKLQYKSSNISGSSYAGNLRISDIKFLNV